MLAWLETQRCSEQILGCPVVEQDCIVLHDFFPASILRGLKEIISSSDTRRVEFALREVATVPVALVEAQRHAEVETSLRFNYAILKWYRTEDSYRSGAYDFHIDPPRFRSIPLFLCTLSGRAKLEYIDAKGVTHEVDCFENQVNLLTPTLRHRVTPPIDGSTERLFFFLGWNTELPQS